MHALFGDERETEERWISFRVEEAEIRRRDEAEGEKWKKGRSLAQQLHRSQCDSTLLLFSLVKFLDFSFF